MQSSPINNSGVLHWIGSNPTKSYLIGLTLALLFSAAVIALAHLGADSSPSLYKMGSFMFGSDAAIIITSLALAALYLLIPLVIWRFTRPKSEPLQIVVHDRPKGEPVQPVDIPGDPADADVLSHPPSSGLWADFAAGWDAPLSDGGADADALPRSRSGNGASADALSRSPSGSEAEADAPPCSRPGSPSSLGNRSRSGSEASLESRSRSGSEAEANAPLLPRSPSVKSTNAPVFWSEEDYERLIRSAPLARRSLLIRPNHPPTLLTEIYLAHDHDLWSVKVPELEPEYANFAGLHKVEFIFIDAGSTTTEVQELASQVLSDPRLQSIRQGILEET